MDTFEGDPQAPSSLHKYVYATANPIGKRDPSGNDSLAEFSIATAAYTALATMAILSTAAAFNIAYGLTNLPKHPFSKPPDAAIVGFQVTANVGRALRKAAVTPVEVGLSIGLQFLSVGGGFEALFPKTFDAVWTYGYWGAFYSLPITGDSGTDGFVKDFPSISIAPNLNTDFLDAAAYAGAAWNTKTPQDYSGPFECVSGAIATRFAGISVRPDASVCSSPPKSDGTAGAYSLVLNRLGSGSSIGTSITSYSFLGSIHF